ncbi:hypothetical protein AB0N14_29675 [Streptomyces sp. NPDC051104]|uniref:hypothetical protein n=1 Tax=Streptomyces sp. NPDC051104 TaxID=3155044 RepID=UPI0034178CBA
MSQELSRRSFVGAATTVAGVAAAAPLLSACGGGGDQRTGANTESGLKAALPAYVPINPVKPDIAPVTGSDGAVTDPGFLRYPSERATTVKGVPGKGGSYTAVTPLGGHGPDAGQLVLRGHEQGPRHQAHDEAGGQAVNVKRLYKPVFWGMNIAMPQAMSTAGAAQSVNDVVRGCYFGKKKVKDVQEAIASWKSSSGDRLKRWMTENVLEKYGTGQ